MRSGRSVSGLLTVSLLILFLFLPVSAEAGSMNDYCINPPFIVSGVNPNLMLMFDNSSSMYDLTYIDEGKEGTCSVAGTGCFSDTDCPAGETCDGERAPSYCYDETYIKTTQYLGYFDNDVIYVYDAAEERFESGAFPANCSHQIPTSGSPTELCVNMNVSPVTLAARGNYLNWLTSSKLDVQKDILTGGKYVDKACSDSSTIACTADADCPAGETCDDVDNFLQKESRGCVGRGFIKEALTEDFQNYASSDPPAPGDDPNTPLNITFSVRGPESEYNPTAPSPGGQTYIEIYQGDYNQYDCQEAIQSIIDNEPPGIQKPRIDACLSSGGAVQKVCENRNSLTCAVSQECRGRCEDTDGDLDEECSNDVTFACTKNADCNFGACVEPGESLTSQSLVVFNQTVQACWQLKKFLDSGGAEGADICEDEANTVTNHCPDVYAAVETFTCSKDPTTNCTVNADCAPDKGICLTGGPESIVPGNISLLCNINYTGFCYAGSSPLWESVWSDMGYAAGGCRRTDGTLKAMDAVETCIVERHREFCGDLNVPPVVDPTDDPSVSTNYDNLPALISEIAIQGQLGDPIGIFRVRKRDDISPEGLIQEFEDFIRFGAMAFNYDGSASECTLYCSGNTGISCTSDATCIAAGAGTCTVSGPPLPCPEVCSNDTDITCTTFMDCPPDTPNPTCDPIARNTDNLDGAEIIHYISTGGTCSSSGNPCVTDANCGVGEGCIIPVGDHNTGLIRAIDDIRATTWTPFAEGYFNAIGYLAKESTEAYADPPALGNSRNDGADPDLRINASDFDMDKNPSLYRCQTNNVLLISDGMSTTDLHADVDTFADLYDTDNQVGACADFAGSKNLDDLSWIAHNRNIKTVTTSGVAATDEPAELSEQVNTYVVYTGAQTITIGTCSGSGIDCTVDADCGGAETCTFEECDPQVLMTQTATNGGTTMYQPENPQELEENLRSAFETISGKAASGTAASVLASGEGAGANLIQAIFYPKRVFDGGICDDSTATTCTVDADCAVGEKCFDRNICGTDCSANGDADCSGGQICLNSNRCVTPCTADADCAANEACLDEVRWTGTLHNFWYYLDPRLGDSTIREDTATPNELTLDQDYILAFEFDTTDKTTKALRFQDTDGDGDVDAGPVEPAGIALDEVAFLWEAGELLWEREPMTRTIKTTLNSTSLIDFSTANVDNNTINVSEFSLEMPDGDFSRGGAIGPNDAKILIEYIHGKDHTLLRSRAVGIDQNADGDTADSGETNTWKLGDIVNATPRIVSWVPLNFYHRDYGDVTYRKFIDVNHGYCSVSSSTACTADADCNALSPAGQTCVFTAYRNRGSVDGGTAYGTGMVFADGNDGMLHAFKLGAFELIEDATTTKAELHASGNALGYEEWSFIPKSVLPYLQYLTKDGYCHLYFVDQTPYIFDASIDIDETSDIDGSGGVTAADQPQAADSGCNKATNEYWNCKKTIKSWKTILIGGMRLGGGCKNAYDDADADTVAEECEGGVDFDNDGSVDNDDCVLTEDSVDANNAKGRTSYFALDITDPQNPSLMWEFTHPDLGFSTTGPAIVRISGRDPGGATSTRNNALNGRWFVVFGSGPTGPIDTVSHQFMGFSDQDLSIFVLDAKTGTLLKTFDSTDHGMEYAFAGSLNNANIDYDFDYQDDALYLGFTKSEAAVPTNATRWLKGGILRLITREDIDDADVTTAAGTTALDPDNWEVSVLLDEKGGAATNIGPVTSSVAHLAFYPPRSKTPSRAFLYFGTGRFHYKKPGAVDDRTGDRALFGIREMCLDNLKDQTAINTGTVCTASEELEFCDDPRNTAPCGDIFNATTIIPTRAQIDAATYKGWFINLDDEAGTIGDERVITDPLAAPTGAVFFTSFGPSNDLCEFGGDSFLWAVNFESGGAVNDAVTGKALLQVSTGAIEEIELKSALTERGDRRTSAIAGIPPLGQGLNIIIPPQAIDRVLHIKKE